ncbi:MAG: FadR family transcriptional regulator [Proteobacteria bacterium]|nr:FadR family transcriptional regulator [Pseudomonadota bacterium]
MSGHELTGWGRDQAERSPLARGVVEHLQRLILSGGLKAGDRLPSQRDLADELGISRPSLREALTMLETMGLVKIRVGSGVYVAGPDGRPPIWRFSNRCSPGDVYEARFGLEGFAASLAARRVDAAATARLEQLVEDMATAIRAGDLIGVATADEQFHDLVFELAGNPALAGMYRPMRDMMVESQRLPMGSLPRLSETLAEHRLICARLAARDPEGAARAMQQHIAAAAARYGVTLERV